MSARKRVKYVELNDFRAYNGKMNFDFTTDLGEVADLIAIYAPNGVGKTSFFDAIEWGITGKIDRLENDIGDDKYKGYILKNRYSIEDTANVKIILENEQFITRKTRRLTENQLQDYTAGRKKSDNNEVFDFNNWDALILPHNRIESFIKDNTGSKKYDYWGNYWDPTGEERKKFEFLYKIKKQAYCRLENLNFEIKENKLKLEEFEKTSDFIDNVNQSIKRFNKLVNIKERITYLNSNFSSKDYGVLINDVEVKKKKLESKISKYESTINDLKTLDETFIKLFENNKNELNFYRHIYQSWHQISLKANDKSNYIEQLSKLKEKLFVNNYQLECLREIYAAGDQWFKSYDTYKSAKLFMNSMLEKRKELEKQLLYNEDQKKMLCEKRDDLISMNNIEERKTRVNENSSYLHKIERILKRKEKWMNYFSELSNKVEDQIILSENTKVDLENSVIKDTNKVRLMQLAIKSINIKEKEDIITTLESLISERQETEIKISVEKGKYETAEKLSNELSEIIKSARNYINSQKSKVCPVCNKEYKSSEELLLKTNVTKSDIVTTYLNKWRQYECELKEINNQIQIIIKKWNDNIDLMLEESQKNINRCKSIRKRIELIKSQIKKDQMKNRNDYEACLNEIRNLGYFDLEISKELIEVWYYKELEKYNNDLSNLKEKIMEINKETEKNKFSLENLLKEYEFKKIESASFENSSINLKFIDFIKKNNLGENVTSIKERVSNIEKNNLTLNQHQDKINSRLELLKWVDNNKIDYYRNKAQQSSLIVKEKANEYKEKCDKLINVIGSTVLSEKTITKKIKKLRKSIQLSKQKLDTIAIIQFSGEIQEYLNSKVKLEKNLEILSDNVLKCKEASNKLEDVYLAAKKVIEEKITSVLNTPLINDFYKKIEPHPVMRNMKYSLKFNDKDKPELEMLVASEEEEYIPEWYFSSAQLNVVALTTFFGRANSVQYSPIDTIFIDDPVGHFDELNILAFIDLLRAIIEKKKKQIIISTHDEVVYNLLKRKLSEKFYLTKFIELGYRD